MTLPNQSNSASASKSGNQYTASLFTRVADKTNAVSFLKQHTESGRYAEIIRLNEEQKILNYKIALFKRYGALLEKVMDKKESLDKLPKLFEQETLAAQDEMCQGARENFAYCERFRGVNGEIIVLNDDIREKLLKKFRQRLVDETVVYQDVIYVTEPLLHHTRLYFQQAVEQAEKKIEDMHEEQGRLGMRLDAELTLLKQKKQAAVWYDESPVMLACAQGDVEQVVALCASGSLSQFVLKSQDCEFAPIHIAVLYGHLLVLRVLKGFGVDMKVSCHDGSSLLHMAVDTQNEAFFNYLLPLSDVNAQGRMGRTALHMAAFIGQEVMVRKLLLSFARVDIVSSQTDLARTVLHSAVEGKNPAIIKLLVASGADLEKADLSGYTPLEHAVSMVSLEVVEILVELGAKSDHQKIASIIDPIIRIEASSGTVSENSIAQKIKTYFEKLIMRDSGPELF